MTNYEDCAFSKLFGLTLESVEGLEKGSQMVVFKTKHNDGTYRMHHRQNCCEHVEIVDVTGDVADLIGEEIIRAEESVYEGDDTKDEYGELMRTIWTFYKLATKKGYVDFRWCGQSNGCYSERVDFEEVFDE